jgi:hypothetical protein
MTPDQRWAINQDFLDSAIAAGEQIILATAPEKIPMGSTLEMDLDYLASYGYVARWSMGGSTVKREDPRFKATVLTLKDWGFNLWEQSGPDPKHFGNWLLIGVRNALAIRITRDREDVNLDVMPAALFQQGASEGDWYNWDVVARAVGFH